MSKSSFLFIFPSCLLIIDDINDLILEKLAKDLVRELARLLNRIDFALFLNGERRGDQRTGVHFLEARIVDSLVPVAYKLAFEFLFRKCADSLTLEHIHSQLKDQYSI